MADSPGHAIVGGLGHLGARIAGLLRRRGYAVTAIDQAIDEETRHTLDALDCRMLAGDLRSEPTLAAAGVDDAAVCLFVSGDDRANLEAAITAHMRNPRAAVVLRLFDLNMARQVERALGVRALSASAIAAPAFVAAATDDDILAVIPIGEQRVQLYRAPLTHPEVHGCATVPLAMTRGQVRVCAPAETPDFLAVLADARATSCRPPAPRTRQAARPGEWLRGLRNRWRATAPVTRSLIILFSLFLALNVVVFSLFGGLTPLDAFYFVITTVTTVGYGDYNLQHMPPLLKAFGVLTMVGGAALLATLYALIADRVLAVRMEYLLGRRSVAMCGHTVVIGLGNVGFRVAEDLAALGSAVVAVEAREDAPNLHAARALFPVIVGDAGHADVLQRASLPHAAVLLAITDDPMLNLSVALHAAEVNPGIRTIIRTFEANLADEFKHLGLFEAISTSAIAAPVYVDAALHPGVYGSLALDGTDLLLVRHQIAEGATVAEIGARDGLAVLAVIGSPHAVEADTLLPPGSEVIALVARETLAALHVA